MLLLHTYLTTGSTFHGLHAIIPQIAPILSSGIERLETDSFVLQSLQTLTGMKFVITAKPGTVELLELLQNMYEIYSDFVLKVMLLNAAPSYVVISMLSPDIVVNYSPPRIHSMKWRCRYDAIYSIDIWTS